MNNDDFTRPDSKLIEYLNSLQRYARHINGGPHSFHNVPVKKLDTIVSQNIVLAKALYLLLFVPTKEKKIKVNFYR